MISGNSRLAGLEKVNFTVRSPVFSTLETLA